MTTTAPAPLDDAGIAALADRIGGADPALFLDYDGTLTGIAPRPDQAVLDPAMRTRLERIAKLCPVGIISGRDLEDVRAMVAVPGLIYAGSHGFDIDAPKGRHQMGEDYRPALTRAADAIEAALSGIDGALVERKRYAIAVHTRQVAEADKGRVADAVAEAAARESQLRRTGGKELFELRPDLPWDKGRALLHVVKEEGLEGRLPIYVGDDLTDEDAFRAIKERGIGIRVDSEGHATDAAYVVPDIPAVGRLLDLLCDRLAGGGR